MQNQNAYNAYKKTSITTASKEGLLIMLYDGAIKFCKLAKKAMKEKKISEKGTYIGRAHDIIIELNNSLNFEIGGDIARNLEKLYMFMVDELIKANLNNKEESLDTVIALLTTLKDGWEKAVVNLKQQEASKKDDKQETDISG